MDIKTEKLQADGSQFTRWNDLAAERVGGQVRDRFLGCYLIAIVD